MSIPKYSFCSLALCMLVNAMVLTRMDLHITNALVQIYDIPAVSVLPPYHMDPSSENHSKSPPSRTSYSAEMHGISRSEHEGQCSILFPRWRKIVNLKSVFHAVQRNPFLCRLVEPSPAHPTTFKHFELSDASTFLLLTFLFKMSPAGNGTSVPLDCPQCGQSFRRREHLSRHLDRHSGARTYACSICKKTFPRRCAWLSFGQTLFTLPMRAPADGLA